MNRNYQKELENIINHISKDEIPSLLLHSCCAPCSSYVLEYLSAYFNITVFYYNPNISPEAEYDKRVGEQKKFIDTYPFKNPVKYMVGEYEPNLFYHAVKGHEEDKEGSERCFICYRLRIEEAVKMAKNYGFDYVTTTLTISPLKNAIRLNEIGEELGERYGVNYLSSDFKKKNGYKRSIELSKEYNLYRQDYCGCIFSKRERQKMEETSL